MGLEDSTHPTGSELEKQSRFRRAEPRKGPGERVRRNGWGERRGVSPPWVRFHGGLTPPLARFHGGLTPRRSPDSTAGLRRAARLFDCFSPSDDAAHSPGSARLPIVSQPLRPPGGSRRLDPPYGLRPPGGSRRLDPPYGLRAAGYWICLGRGSWTDLFCSWITPFSGASVTTFSVNNGAAFFR